MSFILRNWLRATCLVGTGAALVGIAILGSMLVATDMSQNEQTPRIADILTMETGGLRTIQLRDQTAIVVLQSILNSDAEFEGAVSGTAPYQIFVHPTDRKSYSYSPSQIWKIKDQFVWRHDGRMMTLNGSLTDFLEWLKIRRCNQLCRDTNLTARRQGQELRKSRLGEWTKTLIRIGRSKNHWFAEAGLREVTELLSDTPASVSAGIPGEPDLVIRQADSEPNREAIKALLSLVKNSPSPELSREAKLAALHCLQAIGNRSTGNELAALLEEQQADLPGDQLLAAVEGLFGIPPTYERFGICGNSTDEEMARFAREEAARRKAAITDLLAWHRDHVQDSDEQFYDAVVLRWSEMLVHVADTPDQNYSYHHDQTPASKIRNLLSCGSRVISALKRRQKNAAGDWRELAMLEFAIAFLTAECDSDLVKKLLAGSAKQQRIGCSILAVAADSRFDERLVRLLRVPLGDSNVHESVAVRSVAAQALFRSKGIAALPDLRAAMKAGFDSPMLQQILVYLEVPAAQY